MSKYIVNDDDIDDWIKRLKGVLESDEDIQSIMSDIEYVVSEMINVVEDNELSFKLRMEKENG